MTDADRRDSLLDRDWGDLWDTLPEAPPLVVGQPKAAQITLRMPGHVVAALRAVASQKSLPYHALARSWILEGLRSGQLPDARVELVDEEAPDAEQLNLKLEPDVLEGLKVLSDKLRRPYHRLARQWIEAALLQEKNGLASSDPKPRPAMKELMILLLHASGAQGRGAAIRGATRLQKLLFVIEQKLVVDGSRFYAYNYGPYNEQVNDAAQALRVQGLLRGSQASSASPPSFDEMMATVREHSGPRDDRQTEEFELSAEGHAAAERLRRSNIAYERLFARIGELRQEWDTEDLLDRVYESFPTYTEKSLIKDVLGRRRARRRGRSS